MKGTLQSIFEQGFSAYAQDHGLAAKHYKAANAIINCRTEAMGGHIQRCPDNHEQHIQYHSCKHRSCPQCNALPKARWVEAQQARLLHCDHYHVVFTLPHELLNLWRYNTHWFADTLFQTARDTLITLLKDPKHLGALPGILMALHTWGRTLNLHPHIHCLVTGGGLDDANEWRRLPYDYLLPVAVVKALYRGKLLARLWSALSQHELTLPPDTTQGQVQRLLRQLGDKTWNVRIQERYEHGRGVMLYLSRYIKGGAITQQRLVNASPEQVIFAYKDHRDKQHKTMTLPQTQFIERILWHVPETGQHIVRHYGLYSHQGRGKRNRCRTFLNQAPEQDKIDPVDWQRFMVEQGKPAAGTCTQCGQALVRCVSIAPLKQRLKNSINKCQWRDLVQPALQPDTAQGPNLNKGPPNLH